MHSPIDRNSCESENGHVYSDGLDQEHQVAHEAAERPPVRAEGVGQREGDAGHAHQHVREGQVADEEVGDIVHLLRAADDVDQKVVAKDAHQHHKNVTGDDNRLEGLQQGDVCKEIVVGGRGVLDHRHLVHLASRRLCTTLPARALHPLITALLSPPAGRKHKGYRWLMCDIQIKGCSVVASQTSTFVLTQS